MLKDFYYGSCLFCLTIFRLWSLTDGVSDPVTCPSIYIDFLCIPFRFDGKSWTRAMRTCLDYAVQEFSGANMAAIPSASRQKGIEKFLDRIIMSPLWIGGVENRVVWRWRKDNLDLLSQGCYYNLSSNFFQVFSSDNIMTVGKCLDICKKASNGYAAINNMNLCFCGDVINRADKSEGSNCNFTCSSTNQFSWWCGGHNDSYFNIFRVGGVGAKWGSGQPDNQSGREFCAAIDLNLNGGLADEDCNQTHLFACSFGASKQGCQATGQRLISQVCYYLSNQSLLMTWQEAGQSCQDMGAELVTLNSDLQQMALRNWIAQTYGQPDMKVWVGAYIGGWRWLAANTFTYTNWAPDEPQTSSRSLSAPLSSPVPLSPDNDNDNDDKMACIMMKKSNTTYPWIAMKCSTSPVFFICQRGYDYYKSYDSDIWSDPYPQENMDPSWFTPSTTQGTPIRSSTHLTSTQSTITTQNIVTSSAYITTTISTMIHQTSVINNIDRTNNSNNNISNNDSTNNNNQNNGSNNNNNNTNNNNNNSNNTSNNNNNNNNTNNNNNNNNNTNNNNNNNNNTNNNNNGDYLLPPQSVVENETFSKMKIAIIAFIIILFLLFILLVLMCILLCCYCRKRQKTLTVKELDARPVAHLPESDAGHVMTTSSTERLQDHDQLER